MVTGFLLEIDRDEFVPRIADSEDCRGTFVRTHRKGGGEVGDALPESLIGSLLEVVGEADRATFALFGIRFVSCDLLEPGIVVVFVMDDAEVEMFCDRLQCLEPLLGFLWWVDVAVAEKEDRFITKFPKPFDGAGGAWSTTAMEQQWFSFHDCTVTSIQSRCKSPYGWQYNVNYGMIGINRTGGLL